MSAETIETNSLIKTIAAPPADTLSDYYQSYLKYIDPGADLLAHLKSQQHSTRQLLDRIQPDQETHRYAPGKWMLKEVVGHLSDTERILSYRALTFARRDPSPLPGFDENSYTPASNYARRPLANIASELFIIRSSTIALFENMDPEMLDYSGTANQSKVTVRGICYFIYVHQQHHLRVISERYLGLKS